MADPQAHVRRLLAQLRSQLDASASLDSETRAHLEATAREIEQSLAGKAPAKRGGSLAGRLEHATVDFETSHPTLAGTVGSIIDALAQMGI